MQFACALAALILLVSVSDSFATITVTYTGGGTAAQNVAPGQSNVVVYTYSVTIGGTTGSDNLNNVSFSTTSSATSTNDISSYYVYIRNGSAGAPVYIGSVVATSGATVNYSIPAMPYPISLANGTYSFTILANFKQTAVAGDNVSVSAPIGTSLTFGTAPTSSTFSAVAGNPATIVQTLSTKYFAETGATQTYVVPPGCTSLAITAAGAQGGPNNYYNNNKVAGGGLGGLVTETVTVTPGTSYAVMVGGLGGQSNTGGSTTPAGGFDGGAAGGIWPCCGAGGGGGGASYVCTGAFSTSSAGLLLVAGGGGGAG